MRVMRRPAGLHDWLVYATCDSMVLRAAAALSHALSCYRGHCGYKEGSRLDTGCPCVCQSTHSPCFVHITAHALPPDVA